VGGSETVGPQYFQTMRIPLVHGRDFDERDQEDARGVVIINETMAQRYWPKGDALGRRLKLTQDWLEIDCGRTIWRARHDNASAI
jgi:hypothetical protein